jgi:protease II
MKKITDCFRFIILLSIVVIISGCNHSRPPVAEQIASEKVIHGVRISDPYKWMENPKDPRTIAYLNDENLYAGHYFDRISGLKEKLLKEFEERDAFEKKQGTTAILEGNYFYFSRIPSGKGLPVHYRKLNKDNAREEPLLDENELAKGSLRFRMDQFLSSPDNSRYFYCYTLNGDKSRMIIRSAGKMEVSDSIIAPLTIAAWVPDGKSIVYVKDKKEVLVHKINTPASQDISIYTEKRDD